MKKTTGLALLMVIVVMFGVGIKVSDLKKEKSEKENYASTILEIEQLRMSLKQLENSNPMVEKSKVIIYLTDIKNNSYNISVNLSCRSGCDELLFLGDYIGYNWIYLKDMDELSLTERNVAELRAEILQANGFLIDFNYALDEEKYFDLMHKCVGEITEKYPDNTLIMSYMNRVDTQNRN